MRRDILFAAAVAVVLGACGSDAKEAASTTAPPAAATVVGATVPATSAPAVTTAEATTVAVTAAPETTPATAAATSAAPTTVAAATSTTYPAGSNKDDGIVDAAEGELVRNDLRAQGYTVVPDMFTDERLQQLATESCGRTSQYQTLPDFYAAEFPAVLNAIGVLGTGTAKTLEANSSWQIRALVDATSTACGTEVARILSGG